MTKISLFLLGIQTVFAKTDPSEKEAVSGTGIFDFVLGQLPLWITAIIIFVVSLIIGVIVKGIVENRLASKISDEHQEILIISGRIAFLIVAIIGTSISLAVAGINITTLLAAIGFGISFGLQDTIANFVAGIALLASRPFTIGDWIKINGKTGKVVEIRTRATYLKTYDGMRLIVPNSQLYKTSVLSLTSNPMRRLKIPVYCRYEANIKDVMAICMHVVKKNSKIYLEPKPNIVIQDLADSYITLQVRFWVDSKGPWRRVQSRIFIGIQNELVKAGLDSPYAVTSLSLEPEFESTIIKTKQVDSEEMEKIMNGRAKEEEKNLQKKKNLAAETVSIALTQTEPDKNGNQFLITTPPPST
mgnify:CR=1 FL=1